MIKYFAVENFYSIKPENILEFDLNANKDTDFSSNPIIGFAGANASGKTAILQAITFILWFMQDSFLRLEEDDEILFEPFCTLAEKPTKIHIIFTKNFLVDGEYKPVDYEYIIRLTTEKVLTEELYYYPYGRKRQVYIRKENKVEFGASISHIQTKDLRPNCSIISFAAQFGSQEVARSCKNYGYSSNVRFGGFEEHEFHPAIFEDLLKDEKTRRRTRTFLKIADVGIEDVYIIERKEETERILQSLEEMDEDIKKQLPMKLFDDIRRLNEQTDDIVLKEVFFKHMIDNASIDFEASSESSGTLKFLAILYEVLSALESGTLLILDEIELKLHQNLVAYLIGLFENSSENIHGAQLIFSFHNTALMKILKPSQLWFAEKNNEGYTELFCAADFQDIKQLHKKSLEKLYRIGRFGAIPRGI
ncbi:MAG: ATP-binding protein [Deltaproteobacteria bacterium]|nr:ATP-binding protein [Deltaproteobacteria bacterium]